MDLWTEYEGITIDGEFPLKKLVQGEGRSAFFNTLNDKGETVSLRLIECHFDEDEILARWRGVDALGHPNFLKLDRFGQLVLDDTTVVYAVFERTDADLAQVLAEGRLSLRDTTQIGLSAASALDTLHTSGFVHEHVEPRNIFAVGEVVKLRSDCIRETPEGEAGDKARRRDVHDFALVLMQALLGGHRSESLTGADMAVLTRLPSPFDAIVRNGMSGEWGFPEITAALHGIKTAPETTRHPAAPILPAKEQVHSPVESAPQPSSAQARVLPQAETHRTLTTEQALAAKIRSIGAAAGRSFESPLEKRWIAAAIVLVVLLLVGWGAMHRLTRRGQNALPAASASSAVRATHPAASSARNGAPSRKTAPAQQGVARPAGGHGWYVVAYTYNRPDQARKKAASLAMRHPDLRPDVVSPTGRSPYLVTIGGSLDRDAAYSLARTARALGMPRDTYATNAGNR